MSGFSFPLAIEPEVLAVSRWAGSCPRRGVHQTPGVVADQAPGPRFHAQCTQWYVSVPYEFVTEFGDTIHRSTHSCRNVWQNIYCNYFCCSFEATVPKHWFHTPLSKHGFQNEPHGCPAPACGRRTPRGWSVNRCSTASMPSPRRRSPTRPPGHHVGRRGRVSGTHVWLFHGYFHQFFPKNPRDFLLLFVLPLISLTILDVCHNMLFLYYFFSFFIIFEIIIFNFSDQ